jgi:hypothetical protein
MDRSRAVGAELDSFGSMMPISLPANSQMARTTSRTPITTVANGRYFCTEAISGETTRPKRPNTVRNPTDMAMVAMPARASAAGRDGAWLLPAITKPK